MKQVKKMLNVLLILLVVLTNFMPPFISRVNAEETKVDTIDMSKNYKLYIYYSDDRVPVGSYGSYEEAKAIMNTIESKPNGTATILAGDNIIDTAYGVVHMDQPVGSGRRVDEYVMNIYNTASDAYYAAHNSPRTELTYVAGSWGVDAAFIEYNPMYGAYKIKLSGVIGWVKQEYVSIVPISTYYGATWHYQSNSAKIKVTATDNITVRSGASTSSNQACSGCVATYNSVYTYYPSKTIKDNEYTWYYIKYDANNYGYIASKNENWVVELNTLLTDTFYFTNNNEIYHQIHFKENSYDYYKRLGTAPFVYNTQGVRTYYLKNNTNISSEQTILNRYLSFDGNYFYEDYKDMIDDYRAGTYARALNYEYPYYAYFMYVPSRTKTNMTADTINQAIINSGKTSSLTHDIDYYYDANGNLVHGLGTESIMYGTGQYFIDAANKYGVNPLAIYTAAVRESGTGTSAIALRKNNLFGYGASDDAPFTNAKPYPSIADSILEHARILGGKSNYTDIYNQHYHGTHKGNKLSGTSVYYMSDPYAGDKDTAESYRTDINSGGTENYSNTLGIKNNNEVVSIYSEPSSTSRVIYTTKNYNTNFTLTNLPFIVADKVYTYENNKYQGYYKVYTDLSLNEDRTINADAIYDFDVCYGYIKEEDLYVQNKQPEIQASNIEIKQFDELDLMKNVVATDYEDGTITNKISISSNNVDIEKIGVYNVSYKVADSSNFGTTKTIQVTVNATDAPIISADTISIPQYKNFDPKTGVTVFDNKFGDMTSKLEVTANEVRTDTLGEYHVTYKAINDAGVTSTKIRTVKVITNQRPVIEAKNITKYLDDSFDYRDGITALDSEDGDLTDKIIVEGTVDTSKVGNNTLTYTVSDLDGQTTIKNITVTVEEREFLSKDSIFKLDKLLYNEETKKVDFTGFLIIKDIKNTLDTPISYSIIFENQYNGKTIIKNLARLKNNQPFINNNISGYTNEGAWFKESLDLSSLESGNYNVYVRARSNGFESKILLRNASFEGTDIVSSKFAIDGKGYQFRINYYNKVVPLELMVRDNGLVTNKNTPTIDNMYNQLYSINLDGNNLVIKASSHNVGGDYGKNADVKRYITFENIETQQKYLLTDVGFITDGPYKIKLKVDDGFDKTKAWYNASIDISSLPVGTYSIIVRTSTGDIDDYGELYDIFDTISKNDDITSSTTIGTKKVSISINQKIRYRIELTVE